MIKLELRRLRSVWHNTKWNESIPDKGVILETRHNISDPDINKFFAKEFGEDGNGGIDNALSYVGQKYGGGSYQLRVYRHGKYCWSQRFELAGLPKPTYVSPFSGEVK